MAYYNYALPDDVRLFCMAAMAAGFQVVMGRQVISVRAPDGTRIGAWDGLHGHWSVPWKLGNERERMLRSHGFFEASSTALRHRWWQRDGETGTAAFHAVCEEIADVKIDCLLFARSHNPLQLSRLDKGHSSSP